MKPLFAPLAAFIMLGSPVHAADSISFIVGGHRVHIEARRHCHSASCLSVSIPGVYEKRGRDRHDEDRYVTASAPAVCAAPASVAPVLQQVVTVPQPQPRVQPPQVQPSQVQLSQVQAARIEATRIQPLETPVIAPLARPAPAPPAVRPADVVSTGPQPVSRITKVSQEVDEEPADSPLGDWQTQGDKGMVRIEPCGQALCGYVLDPSSNAKGQTVLVDMKSKSPSEWSGNIFSRGSGNTYYGTISMKGPNLLKVEACALGRFFCSGNVWKRTDIKPARLISDRSHEPAPRS
jgi:hypothetical protein